MKSLYLIFIVLIPLKCICQTEFVIVGELRFGKDEGVPVFFEKLDGAKFRIIEDNVGDGEELEVRLYSKEPFYKNRGTEIRFKIDKETLDANKEIELLGELYTYLNEEEIVGRFVRSVDISLEENCEKVGPYTYKLKTAVEIWCPEKYSVAKITKELKAKLFEEKILKESYVKEVAEILAFDLKSKKSNKNFLENCYKIHDLISPYLQNNGYFSNEKKGLDKHLAALYADLDAFKDGNYSGRQTLAALERDKFESELVAEEYLKLREKLIFLEKKLVAILFTIPPPDPKPPVNNNCEKRIDVKFVTSITLTDTFSFDRYEYSTMNTDTMVSTVGRANNNFSLSLGIMTNIYLLKNQSPVNFGISIGSGVIIQDDTFDPELYLGVAFAFGKKRLVGINMGVSYSPYEVLNEGYRVGTLVDVPANAEARDIIRRDYRFFPSVSATIPIRWVIDAISGNNPNEDY